MQTIEEKAHEIILTAIARIEEKAVNQIKQNVDTHNAVLLLRHINFVKTQIKREIEELCKQQTNSLEN